MASFLGVNLSRLAIMPRKKPQDRNQEALKKQKSMKN